MRKFYEVKSEFRKTDSETILPTRSTKNSCGYDFVAKKYYTVKPKEVVKIWTDVKVQLEDRDVLLINVRSSSGGIWRLSNTQGWVDADYFENEKNDGNIGIFLENISDEIQEIKKGDKIAQGMITTYSVTDDDSCTTKRVGGYGSTGKSVCNN